MSVSGRGGKAEFADAFAFSFPSHLHARVFCSLYLIFQLVQRSIQASHSRLSPSATPLVMEFIRKIFSWGEQPAASSASCPLPVLYRHARAPSGCVFSSPPTADTRFRLQSEVSLNRLVLPRAVSRLTPFLQRALAALSGLPARPTSTHHILQAYTEDSFYDHLRQRMIPTEPRAMRIAQAQKVLKKTKKSRKYTGKAGAVAAHKLANPKQPKEAKRHKVKKAKARGPRTSRRLNELV